MSYYFRRISPHGDSVFETDCPQFYKGDEYQPIPKAAGAAAIKAQSLARLHEVLKPGDTVYTVLRSVASSGMSRCIDLYVFRDNAPIYLSGLAEDVMSYKRSRRGKGLVVSGCGMDMGFHLVYALGATMWPEGTPEPHGTRNGEPDSDGGYALKHSWL